MGLFLVILGVISVLSSLIFSIISIVNDLSKTIPLALLIIGFSLIKIGREILKNKKDS